MEFVAALLPLMLLAVIVAPPFAMIFRKIGVSPWWAALAVVPFGWLVLPWFVAVRLPDLSRQVDYQEVFGREPSARKSIRRGGE